MVKLLKFCFVILSCSGLMACSVLTETVSDIKDTINGKKVVAEPTELEDFKASYTAKIDWSVSAGDTQAFDFTPALLDSAAYIANADGEIKKIEIANGKTVWQIETKEKISGGVGAGSGLILVGTSQGEVLAYTTDGKLAWKAKTSSQVLSAPKVFDNMVIVRAGDSHIFGLDIATGERKWIYERGTPALTLRSSAGITVDGGAVYAGYPGGKLVALRADNGKLLWEATVAQARGVTEIERLVDITSLPVIDGPVVYVVAYQGRVVAVDRRGGQVIWSRDISSLTGMTNSGNKLFVSHALGAVYAIDNASGKTFWRQPGLINRKVSMPAALNSMVAVGDLDGYLHYLSQDDGKFVGRIRLDSNPVMALLAGNSESQLLALTRNGSLFAVSVK